MSASAESTKSTALTIPRSTTTNKALLERLRNVETALTGEQLTFSNQGGDGNVHIKRWDVELLAEGGYNHVWLVSYLVEYQEVNGKKIKSHRRVIIREPNQNALPCQIQNEIAFLTYLAKHHSSIPVPKVFSYSTEHVGSNSPYIAMEYIEGQPLDALWGSLTQPEKETIVDEIAQAIIDLAEINLGGIGGLTLDHALGPTVEGTKLFRGRHKFHSSAYYDIGPYDSTHAYVIACYDKDIFYYSHASDEDLGKDCFDYEGQKPRYIAELEATRDRLLADPSLFHPEEPFALVHGDFCGRNIMVHNGHIRAVIDWEFAGSYPLSEVLGGTGIGFFELEDENLREYGEWSDRLRHLIVNKARARGWEEEKTALLVGPGNEELQLARREMGPWDMPEGDADDDGDSDIKDSEKGVSRLSIS